MTYCVSIGLTIMSATPKSELKQQIFLEPTMEKGHVTGMLLTRVQEKLSTKAQRMITEKTYCPALGTCAPASDTSPVFQMVALEKQYVDRIRNGTPGTPGTANSATPTTILAYPTFQ